MKLSHKTSKKILKELSIISNKIKVDKEMDYDKIKDGLLDIIQQIDEENHTCFVSEDEV
tara:strand:- start:193 stop:369 length:177 start_codon:yes stop_codon:yes gene_type:complete